MESNRGSCRRKFRHYAIVASIVLAHRKNVVIKVFELFFDKRSNEVVNISISVGIVIVHHI